MKHYLKIRGCDPENCNKKNSLPFLYLPACVSSELCVAAGWSQGPSQGVSFNQYLTYLPVYLGNCV